MKKFLAVMLAAVLLCGSFAALAEAPAFATMAQAVQEAEFEGLGCGDEDTMGYVVKQGDKYIRVVIQLDQTAVDKQEAARDVSRLEEWPQLAQEAEEYIFSLPVAYTEEITAAPKSQEELDALAGKTVKELEEAGYEWSNTVQDNLKEAAIVRMEAGLFTYDMTLDVTEEEYEAKEAEDAGGECRVTGIRWSGVSWHAADPAYAADGSFVPEQEDLFGAPMDLLNALYEIAQGAEGENLDPEDLVTKLTEKMPDRADEIREMVNAMFFSAEDMEP